MRTKQRNFAIAFVGFIMAIAMVLGFTSLTAKPIMASAEGTPTLTMVSGAQARYNSTDPGIKFTAIVENYDSSYSYGMLILPEKAFTTLKDDNFIGRYHAYFEEKGITNYAYKACGVYEEGGVKKISLALTNIHDYTMGFVGIAYAYKPGFTFDQYIYADVTMEENARSIAYVAQMALNYETGLDDTKTNILEMFTKGDFIIDSEDYLNEDNLTDAGDTIKADYAMKYIFNAANEQVSQITDQAYNGGVEVSFKYFIPSGTVTSWWGIAWHTDASKANIYHAAGIENAMGHYPLSTVTGSWTEVKFTLPEGGPYYLYFGSEVGAAAGRWMVDGENSYALIDDFTIGGTTETFTSRNINNSIFTVLAQSGIAAHMLEKRAFGESYNIQDPTDPTYENEKALKYTFNVGMDAKAPFITKNAYAAGSTVEFMYYVPEGVTYSNAWWIWAWTTDKNNAPYYAQVSTPVTGADLPKPTIGEWTKVSVTLPSTGGPYYIYLTSSVGDWANTNGDAYILIDDFTVNGTLVADFNDGVENSAFEVLNPTCVSDSNGGEGYYLVKKGDLAMKIVFNVNSETVSQMTNAIPGGSKVSFSYYIPTGSTTAWWGIAWHTDPSQASVYHPAGHGNPIGYKALAQTTGQWLTEEIALPAGGPYYLYFGAPVGAWYVDGDNGYVLIDNFTVNGKVETFDYGIENSCFNVLFPGAVVESEGGQIIEKVESMIVFDGDTIGGKENIAFITANTYTGVQEINFRTRWLSSGAGGRWGLSYTTNPSKFAYDDGKTAEEQVTWINCYTPRFGDLKMDDDVWYDYKVVISGGKWHLQCSAVDANEYTEIASGNYYDGANYFYFMICPTASGDTFELYDFSITTASGTVTDNFDDNKSWMFVNSAEKNASHGSTGMKFTEQPASFEAEELGEVAMKYVFNDLGSSVPAMITKEAYAGGSTISLKYYIPAGTVTSWWGIAWHTDPASANVYHAGGASSPMGYQSFSKVLGAWTDVSLTLPSGGPYYLYFGGEISNTNWRFEDGTKSYVLIDEFRVGDVYENFNYGVGNSIFNIKATAATNSSVGEGYVNPYPGEFGAKIYGDKISSTKTTPTFITAQAYTFNTATVVSFDYYMSGNTNSKWWILGWTNNQKTASIYAHVESNKANNDGRDLPTNAQDVWAKASVEVPAGTWYFYIGMAKGEWSGGHVIIDNFKIGDQVTETFNNGITDSIFLVSPFSSHHAAIAEADGLQPFVPGEHAAKFDFTSSFDCVATTFMTNEAVAKGGDTVTLQYYIPEESTVGAWWFFGWSTTRDGASFWVPNQVVTVNGGLGLTTTKGEWVTATINIPTDEEGYTYYLYVCGYENWSGPVYIDNVVVTRAGRVVASEDFNGDPADWMFGIGNSAYVSYGEGTTAPSLPEEPEEIVNPDPHALENLIADGTIVDFLEDGGYASIFNANAGAIDADGIPSTMLLIKGTFKYTITDEKEFAIYLGNSQYVVIDQDSIALYVGTTLMKEVAVTDAENEVIVSITAGGKVVFALDRNSIGLGELNYSVESFTIVALGGNGNVKLENFDIITYKCILSNVPTYFSEEDFDFTAYNFDSENMVSDAGFKLLAEAGFTKTLALQQGRADSLSGVGENGGTVNRSEAERQMAEVNKDALKALDLAQKYGMKHYVFNLALYGIYRHDSAWYDYVDDMAELAEYLDHPAFAGHYLGDEPGYNVISSFSEIDKLCNFYNNEYAAAFSGVPAYANLYPNTHLTVSSTSTYKKYVKKLIDNFGYASYDHYPLEYDSTLTATHLLNAEIVAELCRDNNAEFRAYIKASQSGDSEHGKRETQNINDLYMQIYSLLCYGVREIAYYRITAEEINDASIGDAVIGRNSLQTSTVYEWAKQANNEVRYFEDAYMSFNWKSVSRWGNTDITQFNKLSTSSAGAYGYLSSVSSTASVLVGNFDNKVSGGSSYKDAYAYMIMNYGETSGATEATTDVTVTFNGTPNCVLVYQGGEARVVNLSSNKITLNLMLGEGAFVIPFTNAR